MLVSPRRVATAVLVAGGLSLLATPAAHAITDPALLLSCVAATPNDLTALVDPSAVLADPAALAAPPEVPATHCLAP
ncbi:hypothetical protein [Nonomuraea sp. NPDC050643]|uniref:hypothetical protein n=1 Tax=Nonomuraea sp. NPDC050643 TaxID=3155660 RepID=UPI0033CE2FD4